MPQNLQRRTPHSSPMDSDDETQPFNSKDPELAAAAATAGAPRPPPRASSTGPAQGAVFRAFEQCWGTAIPQGWNLERNASVAFGSVTTILLLFLVSCGVLLMPLVLHRVSPEAPGLQGQAAPQAVSVVAGASAAVAADHPICSDRGLQVMRDLNGTAADAAVVVALCQGILYPFASGLGGGALILVRNGSVAGSERVFDALTSAPVGIDAAKLGGSGSAASMVGGKSVLVPGELRGIEALHHEFGVIKWETLVNSTIDLARDSTVNEALADILSLYRKEIIGTSMEAVFTKPKEHDHDGGETDGGGKAPSLGDELVIDREPLEVGDHLKQEALATLLENIAARGPEFFYHDCARKIVDAVAADGGFLAERDLVDYEIKMRDPVRSFYQGYEILGAPPPSFGGPALAYLLNILEGYHLKKLGRNGVSYHIIVEALKFAFGKSMELSDPAFNDTVHAKVKFMLEKENAMNVRAKIDLGKTHEPFFYSDVLEEPKQNGTSHFSIVDANGLMISFTSSINSPFGSRVLVKDLGIIMNNEMDSFAFTEASQTSFDFHNFHGNNPTAKKRPLTAMSPTIVLQNGLPVMAIGSSGGPRIISSTLQTILSIFDFGDDIGISVLAPRLHHQLLPNRVFMETINEATCATLKRLDSEVYFMHWSTICTELKDLGHDINTMSSVGSVQVVQVQRSRTEEGVMVRTVRAVSDVRKHGRAAAY